jgi:hypothetical protein
MKKEGMNIGLPLRNEAGRPSPLLAKIPLPSAPVEIMEMGGSKSVLCYATFIAGGMPDFDLLQKSSHDFEFKQLY